MKKAGIIVAVVGVLVYLLTLESVKKIIPAGLIPASITDTYLIIGSAILIIFGIVLAFRGKSSKKSQEVPIYQGNKIVGYRRN